MMKKWIIIYIASILSVIFVQKLIQGEIGRSYKEKYTRDSTATVVQIINERKLNKLITDSLKIVLKKNQEKLEEVSKITMDVIPIYVKEIKTDTIVIVKRDTVNRNVESTSSIDQKIKWLRLQSNIVSSFHYDTNSNFSNFKSSLENVFITEDPVELNLIVSSTPEGLKVARLDYDRSRFSNIKLNISRLNTEKRFSLGFGGLISTDNSYKSVIMPVVYLRIKDFNSYIGKFNSLYVSSSVRLRKHYDANVEYMNKFATLRLIYVLF